MSVVDNPGASRYEVFVEGEAGEVGGFVDYLVEGSRIVFTHTEVVVEGRGLGSELVRFALIDARDRGLGVVAQCPFVKAYLEKHPELGVVEV
ncbi:GNAT family N-acetyltransferase [Actinosynnema sp. NPDC020468]|uniref:GNAT family N-acetyltransferase n=1 Tax=Actinosynnema sp. NPDC020468 TaxID=3154488 RepID=UPI0033D0AE1B